MKKSRKRLALHRETLQRLETGALAGVAGASYLSCLTDCEACDPDPPQDPEPLSSPTNCRA